MYQSNPINGKINVQDNSLIKNGKFAYYNLGGGNLTVSVEEVTGSLNRNNIAYSNTYTADIFKLYYSFGTNPENASFAYAVLENSKDTAYNTAEQLPIAKITNTKEIQAIEFLDGTSVIIFHSAGSYTTLGGSLVSAKSACVKIL
jgi:hypothetical protein